MQFAWQAPWSSVGEAEPGWWQAFALSKDVRATRTPDRFIKKQAETNVVALIADEGLEVARAAREEIQTAQETIHDRLERLRAAIEARSTDARAPGTELDPDPAKPRLSEEQLVEKAVHAPVVVEDKAEVTVNHGPIVNESPSEVSLDMDSGPVADEAAEQLIDEAGPAIATELLLPVPRPPATLAFSGFAFQSSLYQVVVVPGPFLIDHSPTEMVALNLGIAVEEEPYEANEINQPTEPEEEVAFPTSESEEAAASDVVESDPGEAVAHDATEDVDMGYLALFGGEFVPAQTVREATAVAQGQITPAEPPATILEDVIPAASGQVAQVIAFPLHERTLQTRDMSAGYELPSIELLAQPPQREGEVLTEDILEERAGRVEKVIRDFGVKGEVIHVHPGPVITLYELEPAPGVKSSRVIALSEDIARSMSAVSARVAVIPGRNAIGIELPNATRETVYLREMLEAADFQASVQRLPICLGKTIGGEPVIADLARMPHLLVAGTTGSGKSVAINTMILSLLYRFTPEQCRLIMVDPKMLELSVYDGIPHLLTPVVTDPKKAIIALRWAVREMEDRYRKMSKLGVRNIDGFNARVVEAKARGEAITRTVETGFDKETGKAVYEEVTLDLTPLPYIVVIVDEMADLMMVAGKEIEGAIQRLAQMARAAGIHVILATQRPSVDVITGTIKANFPTRISFQVTSKIDSRTILGEMGAEQLLGQGDMLYMAGGGRITRVHGPFCSDEEVEKVVNHLKRQGEPVYLDAVTADDEAPEELEVPELSIDEDDAALASADAYEQAVSIVLRHRKASTSYIQRRLQIGYNRAASIMERMEKEGIVGPANHAGKREILRGEFED
ncbi:DNA translocase FtsK [Microvirga sp. CF3016]|nr:DNA translocase FtsK [Microvirga sp. CF3016]MEE1611873.1 DNA translocase FtsK [Microvirga sp. CF3016]